MNKVFLIIGMVLAIVVFSAFVFVVHRVVVSRDPRLIEVESRLENLAEDFVFFAALVEDQPPEIVGQIPSDRFDEIYKESVEIKEILKQVKADMIDNGFDRVEITLAITALEAVGIDHRDSFESRGSVVVHKTYDNDIRTAHFFLSYAGLTDVIREYLRRYSIKFTLWNLFQ